VGESWEWDGVRFEILHPGTAPPVRRNNQSCVLRVAAAGGSMLLTGDIERAAEAEMVRRGGLLKSDVLLVPHHGSRTSSTAELLAAVGPRWAIVPAGYRNRFGHPARDVLDRYGDADVRLLRTDRDGAVDVRLAEQGVRITTERGARPRYWRTPPPV
jgi:competence protein ComEC